MVVLLRRRSLLGRGCLPGKRDVRERKRGAFWSILHLAGREGGGEVTAAVRARHLLYSKGGRANVP